VELEFSSSFVEVIDSFLTDRKFKVFIEGEFSAPRGTVAEVPQGSVLAPILHTLRTNDAPAAPATHLALFADCTCIYASEKHERHVLCKLQGGLIAVNSWCLR
jgi:hypothetical protein